VLKTWLKRRATPRPGQPQPANDPLIELRRVVKKYTGTAGSVTALNGVDLQISAGEFVVVLGKSGAGKTTLVNMITGIDRPTSGEIRVAGTTVHALGEDERALWRGRNVGSSCSSFNSCLR
jgi:putative ABC transport system ATP-binding protein